jgi:serine/threonine protein kinase
MPRQLVVVRGPDQGRVFPLPAAESLLLGRSKATQTRLADPRVSRVHCEVHVDGDRVAVHDFDSIGGTFVNGQRVASQDLAPGDVIRIGDTELRYDADTPAAPPAAAPQDVFFAARPGGRPIAAPLKQLQNLAGQALGGYHLLRVLGVGQIGVVFQARDTKSDKVVALKVLKPDFAKDAQAMRRFLRGLMAARTLEHPNLVALHTAGSTGPYWWIAMELVEGQSLAELLRQQGPGTPLAWARVLRLAVYVGRALDFAHRHGLVHRNVVPDNVLIRGADQVAKLGDLLLARELETAFGAQVTRSGELVGNLYYMAPERTQGGTDVDARSDLYGLGVTVYHALTGRLPFTGGNLAEVVMKIRTAPPERPVKFQPSLPGTFEHAVLKLLAKRPEDRPQTAAELLAVLEQVAKLGACRCEPAPLPPLAPASGERARG